MTFSPRPHPSPCACQECAEWAKAIVATPSVKKPPRNPSQQTPPPSPDEGFFRRMVGVAVKATGMTEEELAAKASETVADVVLQPVRESRETILARGVPEIHVRSVYDAEPLECEAISVVRAFLSGDKTVLVLAGGVGTCKTGSASWALTVKPGCFATADEIVRVSSSKQPEDVDAWRRIRSAQVLVIDDMGGEYYSDSGWGVRVFNGLLDHRYSSGLKTIITTNLHAEKFKQDYGERIADRIREAGRWLTLGGTSVRKRA